MKKFCFALVATFVMASSSLAQTWDETANGGGDAGSYPLGTFQSSGVPAVYNTITGNLFNVPGTTVSDVDAYCITITDQTTFNASTSPQVAGGESDTRLWLWDLAGNLIMANDDTNRTTGGLMAEIGNVSGFWAGSTNSPGTALLGQNYILTVGGFSTNFRDSLNVNLATFSPLNHLHGLNPFSNGVANNIFGTNSTGGAYQVNLRGAVLTAVPEPSAMLLALTGMISLMVRRKR
jgi:hypothetical protein